MSWPKVMNVEPVSLRGRTHPVSTSRSTRHAIARGSPIERKKNARGQREADGKVAHLAEVADDDEREKGQPGDLRSPFRP
jgi:hypothetical protein